MEHRQKRNNKKQTEWTEKKIRAYTTYILPNDATAKVVFDE